MSRLKLEPLVSSRRLLAVLALGAVSLAPARTGAVIVERVVAVVGERAILFSDLRERATPMLLRVYSEVPAGAQRSAAISQVYKALLENLIDEELEARAASQAKIAVTAREVDEALKRIAAQNKLTLEQVMAEAARAGLNERQYRTEIRRQLLQAKLLNVRLQGRIRVGEEDLRAAYRRLVAEERRKQRFHAGWIAFDLPRDASPSQVAAQRAEAERIALASARGADFAALARKHSDDASTRASGGSLGWRKPGQLAPELDRAALSLDAGAVSPPLRVGERIVILKMLERESSELPSYEEARAELAERVYMEKMNKARRQWLDSLRRRTHVDIRM